MEEKENIKKESLDDYFNKCLGKHSNRLGLYHPVYCCHIDPEEHHCSRRYVYDGENTILLESNPYCKPFWGKQDKYKLEPDP